MREFPGGAILAPGRGNIATAGRFWGNRKVRHAKAGGGDPGRSRLAKWPVSESIFSGKPTTRQGVVQVK
jgi:hypothetical protein